MTKAPGATSPAPVLAVPTSPVPPPAVPPPAPKLPPASAGQGAAPSPPAAPRPRGRPRVDDKRRIILDAALRAFAERGYHGTAVPEVGQAAGVGTGTLYRYFASKEYLVNEVFRDAKERLRDALLVDLANLDLRRPKDAQHWFQTLWQRLGDFAKREPDAFRFLEMQDHVAYLDADSRHLELAVLDPLWVAGKQLRDRTVGPPVDVSIALLWGAFVGLVKASRLGYLALDDRRLADAGDACWRMIVSARRRPSRKPRKK